MLSSPNRARLIGTLVPRTQPALVRLPEPWTVATLGAGSAANVGGQVFSLNGSFVVFDTAADYNAASPTFALVSGTVPASLLNIAGTDGLGDTLTLTLDSDVSCSLNLPAVWAFIDANGDVAGQSAAINLGVLLGTDDLNGTLLSFTGTTSGTETFNDPSFDPNPAIGLDPAIDDYAFAFDLTASNGTVINGTINATGPEFLVPEPSSLGLVGASLVTFALVRARKRRTFPKKSLATSRPDGERAPSC